MNTNTAFIPETDLGEAKNIFSFLQVPYVLTALKTIVDSQERGTSAIDLCKNQSMDIHGVQTAEDAERIISGTVDRLLFIGMVIKDAEVYRINPNISLTGLRILQALFPPVPSEPDHTTELNRYADMIHKLAEIPGEQEL